MTILTKISSQFFLLTKNNHFREFSSQFFDKKSDKKDNDELKKWNTREFIHMVYILFLWVLNPNNTTNHINSN